MKVEDKAVPIYPHIPFSDYIKLHEIKDEENISINTQVNQAIKDYLCKLGRK